MRLSVIIPAYQAAAELPRALDALEAGRRAGLVAEVVVADGGSTDATPGLAAAAGARLVTAPRGRGSQLAAGAAAAAGDWLLFLHADTALEAGWEEGARAFMAAPGSEQRAAAFRFAVDDPEPAARRLEALVAWRCRVLGLPYGDQGLLLHRDLYRRVGGYRPLPLMEDVDLVRRLGGKRLELLEAAALTSAARYRRAGYLRRSLRNLACLGLYFLGVPPRLLVRLYG